MTSKTGKGGLIGRHWSVEEKEKLKKLYPILPMESLEGDGFGVSIGGYCLDKYDENKRKRVAYHKSFELIDRILEVVGVSTWEELQGKYIRVKSNGFGGRVTKIGNLIKDDWLDFDTFFKEEMMNKQEAIEELERNVVRTTDFDRAEDVVILRDELNEFESEFYTTDDFTTPIECLSEALWDIQSLYAENRIEDKENAGQLIDTYKYAIELLRKAEVE